MQPRPPSTGAAWRVAALAVLCAAVVLAAVAAPAAAQPMDFPQAHQIRVAHGDIPSTSDREPDGRWNFEETLRVDTGDGPVTWAIPAGHSDVSLFCDCRFNNTQEGATITITFENATAGEVSVRIRHAMAGSDDLLAYEPAQRDDTRVFLYVPEDVAVASSADLPSPLPAASRPELAIYDFKDLPARFWVTVAPDSATGPGLGPAAGLDWWLAGVGLVVGAIVWAFLVQRGVVQRRKRRQVAGTAAHVEAAQREDKKTLEGRKRALMAALKELEMAKMNKELDPEAYDRLKADFKRQTVVVMRALEQSASK